jgi:hypothetical protein
VPSSPFPWSGEQEVACTLPSAFKGVQCEGISKLQIQTFHKINFKQPTENVEITGWPLLMVCNRVRIEIK